MKCLVFTRTRVSCRLLAEALQEQGLQGVRYVVGSNEGRNAGGASSGLSKESYDVGGRHGLSSFNWI